LDHEVKRALFEAECDGHEQYHAEGAKHFRYRITQENIVPRKLLLKVALHACFRVTQRVENYAHANVQYYD
jgi:hypothetical protein